MSAMYVIKWSSKVNGRAGKGAKLFTREEAERLAEELNQEYPHISHEAIPASETPQPQPVSAATPAESANDPSSDNEQIVSVE